jgi:O-antigen/teichoic acid export membrane protein
MSLLACGGLSLLVRWDLLGFGALPWWVVWGVWPVLLLTYLAGTGRFVLVREGSYGQLARMLAGQGLGRALAPLALAPWGLGGLLAGEGLGRAIGLVAAWRSCRSLLALAQAAKIGSTLRSAWKYPVVFLPSSLVDVAATLIPLPIVAALYGPAAAGQFALVQRLVAAPIGLIASSVADVFHREAAIRREGSLRAFVLATSGRLFSYSVLPAVGLGALAPALFPWLFGREWAVAGWLFLALVPYAVSAIAVSPVTRVVLVVDRQEIKLVYDVAALALAIGSLAGAHALRLGLVEAVALYSGLQAVAFALYLVLLARVAGGAPSAE